MQVRLSSPGQARNQAEWLVDMEPWQSLNYQAGPLGRYLMRMARRRQVLVAKEARRIIGVLAFQTDFLLGTFIALLAVHPEARGQGVGSTLLERIERATFAKRRWLYVSSDGTNTPAARFYRLAGFERIARLPGLIREDRTEILWRKGRPQQPEKPAKRRTRT